MLTQRAYARARSCASNICIHCASTAQRCTVHGVPCASCGRRTTGQSQCTTVRLEVRRFLCLSRCTLCVRRSWPFWSPFSRLSVSRRLCTKIASGWGFVSGKASWHPILLCACVFVCGYALTHLPTHVQIFPHCSTGARGS